MIEEILLDDPAALERADTSGDLVALALAGARVRTSARLADEAGLARLRPEGRPRMVLVAGHGAAALAGDLLAGLIGTACPVLVLRPTGADPVGTGDPPTRSPAFALGLGWTLPGWAGSLDLLIVASTDGNERGLTTLVEQAYGRGCSVVGVAPAGSRLAEAVQQARGLQLPYAPGSPGSPALAEPSASATEADLPPEDPTAFWALLVPMAMLAARVGLLTSGPDAVAAAADRLDEVAVRCRPDADTYGNPAKALAAQLDAALPLLWSDGPGTGAAAQRFAAMLADRAGRPALTATLPDALTVHRGLIAGQLAASDPDDFFRDRVDDDAAPLRPQILLLRHTPHRGHGATAPDEERSGRPDEGRGNGGGTGPAPGPGPRPAGGPAGSGGAGGGGAGNGGAGYGGAGYGSEGPTGGEEQRPVPEPSASRHSVARAHRLAEAHQVHLEELTSIRADALEALAELVALTDFAAVYLGLASTAAGLDGAGDTADFPGLG
jgi:hypothetical protein